MSGEPQQSSRTATATARAACATGSAFAPSEPETPAAHRQADFGQSGARKLLPFVLSVIAGSVDAIGFLRLNGLFTAHITGNIVILAARILAGARAPVPHLIAVPVFIAAVFLTRVLAGWLDRQRISALTPLLLLQLALLSAFLAVGAAAGKAAEPNAASMILAGMLGVCAMAAQNALVRLSLAGAPSTAPMTTNVTLFAMDLGEMFLTRDSIAIAKARHRAKQSALVIVGFLIGCALGTVAEAAAGLDALTLPVGLALVAAALGVAADSNSAIRKESAR